MVFLVINNVIEWSLDFGPDSVTLTINNFAQEMTMNSLEIPLAAWCMFLSRTQDVSKNHLARVPITSNQDWNIEMRDESLSSVVAQDLDTIGYQASDLDDVDFCWENDQLNVDAVFRTRINTHFSPSIFNSLEMGSMSENPILIDKEQDKEKPSPPHPNNSSLRQNNPTPCVDEKLAIRNKN